MNNGELSIKQLQEAILAIKPSPIVVSLYVSTALWKRWQESKVLDARITFPNLSDIFVYESKFLKPGSFLLVYKQETAK